MNPTTIQWFCVGMAMGCFLVSIIAAIAYWLPESDPPRWSRNVAARSFMAAIVFIGVSIPAGIEPSAAAHDWPSAPVFHPCIGQSGHCGWYKHCRDLQRVGLDRAMVNSGHLCP